MPVDHSRTTIIPSDIFERSIPILKNYFENFICKNLPLILTALVSNFLILFFKPKNNIKFSLFSITNVLFFLSFYTIGSTLLNNIFYVMKDYNFFDFKFIFIFKISLITQSILSLNYLFKNIENKTKIKDDVFKYIACIIIFIALFMQGQTLRLTYYIIKNFDSFYHTLRVKTYQLEKTILSQKDKETIILPSLQKNNFIFIVPNKEKFTYKLYFNMFMHVHGKENFINKQFIISDEKELEPLTEKEEKNLRFSDLLTEPIRKQKITNPNNINWIQ